MITRRYHHVAATDIDYVKQKTKWTLHCDVTFIDSVQESNSNDYYWYWELNLWPNSLVSLLWCLMLKQLTLTALTSKGLSHENFKRICRTIKNKIHYSSVMSFYHIRERERAKYAKVLHCAIQVDRFFAEGSADEAKTKCSGMQTSFTVLWCSAFLSHFCSPFTGLGKILRNSSNICAYYL